MKVWVHPTADLTVARPDLARPDDLEDQLYEFLKQREHLLSKEIRAAAEGVFGVGVVQVEIAWRRASIVIEVVVALIAAATLYKDIVETVEFYREQLNFYGEHLGTVVENFFQTFLPTLQAGVVYTDISVVIPGEAALPMSGPSEQSDSRAPSRYWFFFGLASLATVLFLVGSWLFLTHL